jgi:MATE family multidrug resistance protein
MTSATPDVRMVLALAWPVVLSRSAQALIGFSDALMTAPLGDAAVAATTAGAMNSQALLVLPVGAVFIVQSFAAQYQGRGDHDSARRCGWYGLVLAGLFGLAALALSPSFEPVLGLLDYAPEVRDPMADYMTIRIGAGAFIIALEALGNWYGGLGNTRMHMRANFVALGSNVLLNWLLIEGHWGAPALGVRGAAIASVVATCLAAALLVVAFLRRWELPERASGAGLRRSELLRVLRFGLPNGVNWFLEFSAFVFFVNVVVASLGTTTVAALMAVIQVNAVSFMPAFGLATAGAVLVGQAIGADRRDDVPRLVRLTATIALVWQGTIGLAYFLAPGPIMSVFSTSDGAELVVVGAGLLALSAAWQLFDAVGMTVGEALRAAGDTAFCMWARLGIAWLLFVPGGWWGVRVLDGGGTAAMTAVIAYLAVLAVVLAWRLRAGAWRHIQLTEPRLV